MFYKLYTSVNLLQSTNSQAPFKRTLMAERAQPPSYPSYESAEWVDQLPGFSRSMVQQRVGLGWVAQVSLRSVRFPLYLNKEGAKN